MTWSVPHVSQGRGPEETNGGMANNQTVLGGGHIPTTVRPMEEVATLSC